MKTVWRNWAGEQYCAPSEIVRPASEAELAELVAKAGQRGERVRAVGSGHSFTDCACTDGVMVDMAGMQRIVNVDPEAGLATVEGGAKLRPLFSQLAEHGLALESQGDIDKQSITGATATATHGTGARFANVSAQIVALRLVTASGEVLELSEGDDYLAARVSIGALGVISQLTLKVVPLFTLHRDDELKPLAETLERLDEHVDNNDHFEFFVFPYAETALTRTTRRSEEPPMPVPEWRRRVGDQFENVGLGLVCRTGRQFPSTAPKLNRLLTSLMSPSSVQDRGWKVYPSPRNVKFTEMEYAIPRENAREAVRRVIEVVRRRDLPIMYPLEVRFSAPDDAFLSTAYERDTCYIAVHQYTGMEFETYFRAVEAIMDEYGGRPHWGKRHYQRAASLRERYPAWDRFTAVRDRLDPNRVFLNDYTRRVLGA
ncbi:D-arabinono-1,4-lactone oxidase [Mycobacterium ulcerans]|uniref:Oxidoreductase n=1 Tax=Mycobacterium ulcerans subsp. shinshuense TaxID=1124626 RepID=A0A1B4Y2N4_MYCUL|nr:D-arabinono-1,4-lactone oxidase [Mycobacterium ulcerans]BAV41335.1 oxidoreductase [Mycobacterium ulcerans subsp. shinshuense]